MSDDLEPPPAASGYKIKPAGVWRNARDHYLTGASAAETCEMFGLGLSAFRKRAREEGWRRADQTVEGPFEYEDGPLFIDRPPAPLMSADHAYCRAAQAVQRGNLRAARGWIHVCEHLRRLAAADQDFHLRMDELVEWQDGSGPCDGAEPPAELEVKSAPPGKVHQVHCFHPPSQAPGQPSQII